MQTGGVSHGIRLLFASRKACGGVYPHIFEKEREIPGRVGAAPKARKLPLSNHMDGHRLYCTSFHDGFIRKFFYSPRLKRGWSAHNTNKMQE